MTKQEQEKIKNAKPVIQILWDEEAKDVKVLSDMNILKNWQFTISILEMAVAACKKTKAVHDTQEQMILMQQAQENSRIADAIMGQGQMPNHGIIRGK